MELRQIRYFVEVANEGSFARAAENLRIAQSGLSQQIMVLERSLGARLFDRSVRPVKLTVAGEVFLEKARGILELTNDAVEQVQMTDGNGSSVLRIGGSAFGNAPVADQVLQRARSELPSVDVRINFDIAPHNITALNRREIDAMISYLPYDSPETHNYLNLGTVELVLAIPDSSDLVRYSRVPRAALAREPFLVGPREINAPLLDCMFDLLFGRPEPPDPVRLSSFGSRLHHAAQGAGVSAVFVPAEPMLQLPGLVYRRLEDPVPTFEYGLLWFEDRRSPALDAFLELASRVASEAGQVPTDELMASAL